MAAARHNLSQFYFVTFHSSVFGYNDENGIIKLLHEKNNFMPAVEFTAAAATNELYELSGFPFDLLPIGEN